MNIKLKLTCIIIFSLLVILVIAHFILIDRILFFRTIYPLQAQIAKLKIKCTNNSPIWLKESVKYIIDNQKNLSNQIVYIDDRNKIYTCESGWVGTGVFLIPLTVDTRFRYASLTKLITSDAILNQINKHKISINSKLIDFFPEIKNKEFRDDRFKEITIKYLLEHRSGFDRMQSEDVVFAINKKSWCPYNLKQLSQLKLDFTPGERYAYDNRNYCLLGIVLERLENQTYRSYIRKRYGLREKNIKFIDGSYYPDEVKYDFRNNNFWMESDDNKFDFTALSSSAGLSGSAKQLALLIQSMVKESKNLNILSIDQDTLNNCHLNQFKSCNGYAMWQYQENKNQPKMYFRNGGLPAVTSMAIVTENNEILVWIGNGATLYNEEYDENLLEKYFYNILSEK